MLVLEDLTQELESSAKDFHIENRNNWINKRKMLGMRTAHRAETNNLNKTEIA